LSWEMFIGWQIILIWPAQILNFANLGDFRVFFLAQFWPYSVCAATIAIPNVIWHVTI